MLRRRLLTQRLKLEEAKMMLLGLVVRQLGQL